MSRHIILFLFAIVSNIFAQLDTVKGDWPFSPFTSSLRISATFGEFRNTLSSDHFHNAADVPEPDGNPCYPSLDGTVYYKANDGSNSYIRIVTQVGSEWKHLTYLHVVPNPSLSVGDSVKKGKTILGTIASGMGHVHLIERELVSSISSSGVEINNLRKNGGLTPFVDTWAPAIDASSLKFYTNGGIDRLDADKLFGKVDIQIKIEEINGSSSVDRNNGTYIAGYRVWNVDKTEVVFEPNDAGVKYRFDYKPLDAYVHNAFVKNVATLSNPVYWLTNGDGANIINSSRVVSNNYFDASAHPKGNYQLEIFAEDTRDNKSNAFFPISITDPKPNIPIVYELLNNNGAEGLTIKWKSNSESDILGYRLYYTEDLDGNQWKLVADETQLLNNLNEYSVSSRSDYITVPGWSVNYFKLAAVDIAGQESDLSDLYARSSFPITESRLPFLIVNAFDKLDENGDNISHNYISSYYDPISSSISQGIISSISNDVFLDDVGNINLSDYSMVVWFAGDNTNRDFTIQPKEMAAIASYLINGGNFLISGSKIGYDLDGRMSSDADTLFYYHYLKSKLVDIGDGTQPPAFGVSNTVFEGIDLVFEEEYPDDIYPNNGSSIVMNYSTKRDDETYRNAGISYTGKFANSDKTGKLLYFSFPLESVEDKIELRKFYHKVSEYFQHPVGVDNGLDEKLYDCSLSQNYPNPFNPSTTIKYSIPSIWRNGHNQSTTNVVLKIYDVLGREVATLVNKVQKPGSYELNFNASNLTSGVYFARITSGSFKKTISMLLIK